MKKVLTGISLLFGALFSVAQDTAVPEPEFMNLVYVLDKGNKLQQLEKAQAEMKMKNKTGIGGAKQMYVIGGTKSTVTLPADNLMFVVSAAENSFQDPSTQFQLMKFESKKNAREAIAMAYGGIGNKNKQGDNSNEIAFNLKKLKDGVFGLVPDKTLEKGEYAFINKMSMQGAGMSMKMEAFAFSVE